MMPGLLKHKLTKSLLIALAIAVIVPLFMFAGVLDTWESVISDEFYSPSGADDSIVIVAIDDQSLQELGRWPWPRDYFAQVIDRLNQSSVIGIDVSFFEPAEGDAELALSINKSNVVLAIEYTNFTHKDNKIYGAGLLKPATTLGSPGVDFEIGFVNLFTDSDGVTRSFTPYISGIEDHEHFAMAVVGSYLGSTPYLERSRMLINFFAPPGGYEYISFTDIYHNRTDPSHFKGKIILIGATAANLHDEVIVPKYSEAMPGVELNANLVQSILTRDFLYYQDDVSTIGVILLFALFACIILYRFKIHIATIILAALILAYITFAIYYFESGIIINILFPLLTLVLTYIALVVLYYLTEERSRRWITSVFGKYVSPVVIDNLIKNPDQLNLGGEKRNITLFFSDIRGFTPIAEKLAPEELVHLLNEYLTEMTSIIQKNQGLVDKFMGDAIMAFWGAPLDQPDHAEIACTSSLEMMDKLKDLQKKWKKEGIPGFNIGIGLNSGDAIVGNMGSANRFDYTAIGDNVNLASRMEGLNKIYGTNIIISEHTYNSVNDHLETRKLDRVRVKGKKKPILIFELLAQKGKLSKKHREFIKLYEAGLDLYFAKKWNPALKSFQAALKLMDDPATHVFITRCQEFLKHPPAKEWDGVWEMKTK